MKVSLIYSRMNTSTQPPLGLLWIAAVLEEEGYTVQVIDPAPNSSDFIRQVKRFKPDLVGVSIITTEYPRAVDIIKELKPALPHALFCAGGVHPSALPERTLQELGLDFVVVGEGEYTMREICECLSHNEEIDGVVGIAYRDKSNRIISTGRRPLIANLDELPLPSRQLIDMEWYLTPPGLVRGAFLKRTVGLLATRGCPYECIFCGSNNIFGRKVRRRSIQNLIEEIEELIEKYRIDGYYFYDDTFTVNPQYTLEFCDQLQNHGINLKWGCQVRVDTLTQQLLKRMREAGCIQVDIGVESGSERVLSYLKKGFKPHQIEEAFRFLHKAGIRTLATFTIGNPGETMEDIKATKTLAKRIRPDYVRFFYLTPFPGCELYEMANANGWIKKNIGFSPEWQIRQADWSVMTINFSPQELRKIRANLQNSFLISNYLGFLREWRFALLMLLVLFKHLSKFLREIIRVLRSKRLDYIIELALELYRLDKARRKK